MSNATQQAAPQMVVKSAATGLYFVANKGFVAKQISDATQYPNDGANKAVFRYQWNNVEFVDVSNVYLYGAPSLPLPRVTQEEIDADLAEKATWLPFPKMDTRGKTEA